ncbi:VWA domain-containing protein [Agrococcus sp. TF02-05]|uniref:VWA domain-containing protein n=1 Tax=Agrococcus sp. TF02-05 TaxID=2815211 RepID=UPI001AA12797|nr:VWA domain-containing protein [Agrococcus sp. TF02-05]MBO1769056.1 VWA domain-containing protein [Agrococcus sp. TF02-05]
MLRRIRLATALVAVLAVASSLSAAPALAASPRDDASLMLVLDASGSMAMPDATGAPRIDAARTAIDRALDGLDDEQRVGLRVFGATVLGQESPGACTDSQRVVPVGAGNRDALRAAAVAYAPYGETPIGFALQEAAADLGTDGPRSILLVSDGLANCDPDPCTVAAELAGGGIDLMINVVGFDVDPAAREQLRCVADAGRGAYVDAADAAGLEHALTALAARAFRPFSVVGTPVTGTPDASDAPAIRAGTQWVDELDGSGAERHYVVERDIPGSTLLVGMLGVLPANHRGGAVTIRLEAEGALCGYETVSADGSTQASLIALSAGALEAADDACMTADALELSVTDLGSPAGAVPFELRLVEQPLPANLDALPAAVSAERDWTLGLAEDAAGGELEPGSSLNDPAGIEPGSYRVDILPGETQFFSVPVDWGQSVRAVASFENDTDHPYEAGRLHILDPVGGIASDLLARAADGARWADVAADTRLRLANATPPIALPARRSGEASLAGEHTVVVSLAPMEEPRIIPYTLTVEVVGDPSGTPELAAAPSAMPTPGAAPVETAPLDDGATGAGPLAIGLGVAGGLLVATGLVGLAVWLRARRRA